MPVGSESDREYDRFFATRDPHFSHHQKHAPSHEETDRQADMQADRHTLSHSLLAYVPSVHV